ncbi:Crp/Fnr family transcriptional regulator [Trichormus variabilis]|uniref:Crp/Fnr family transcriptional regulator n=1 Tax=Trichormus variabilis SAG 1403-4b TaxID=447716 RepID=A0A3S1A491_ANAVA|nr:Crp/Fnr family transcriptional regulator [Trichormus variabilis]MBD2629426.1 Crp/Fnr family transcriptional regulator [Trichormus variabilis FACHB-164]RUS93106.1 Crp/Fnr family transcriptional regulator [Trichormus variabilis SAG 1403-4b]
MLLDNNSLRSNNKLLTALPKSDFEHLAPHLELVSLTSGQSIYEAEEPIKYIYFPETAIISLLCIMNNGSSVEVGLVSNEGMVGIPVILGDNITTLNAIVQVPGNALRIDADTVKTEFDRGEAIQDLLLCYVKTIYLEVSQCAACNRLHTLEERLSRWLLTVADRLHSDEFPLTQEFISHMLGVRRSGVTVAASTLSKSGMINYHRGNIKILNREALEASSCECYQVIRNEYARLLDNSPQHHCD